MQWPWVSRKRLEESERWWSHMVERNQQSHAQTFIEGWRAAEAEQ